MSLPQKMNYDVYNTLHGQWMSAKDHPIALLRAEAKFRLPWILDKLSTLPQGIKILDAGCGGGILSNALARHGFDVTGIDQSQESLSFARSLQTSARYVAGDVYALPFADNSFEAVFSMDVLEHLEFYPRFIEEVQRVLKPGGQFVFYTFNRTLLSKLLVIDALEFLFPKTAVGIHLSKWFITPKEISDCLNMHHLSVLEIVGVRPIIFQKPMIELLAHRTVSDDFKFTFCKSLAVGYLGTALKPMV